MVSTPRLSAPSVAEPHVTHTPPVNIRGCRRPSLQPSHGHFGMSYPPLIKPLMRAYHWSIGPAMRPCIYLTEVQALSIVTALAGGLSAYPNTVASPTELQMYEISQLYIN